MLQQGRRNRLYWRKQLVMLLIMTLMFGSFSGIVAPREAAAASAAPGGVSANMELWLKADEGVTTVTSAAYGNVSGWTDQTGTNTFTVTGTPEKKVSGVNFNPVVTFENTTSYNQNPNEYLKGNTAITYKGGYAVFKSRAGTLVGSATPTPGGYGVGLFTSWSSKLWMGNGVNGTYHGFPFADNTRYYLASYDSSNSAAPAGSLNGVSQTLEKHNAFSQIAFTPVIGGTFGGGNSNNWDHYKGELAEVILFNVGHTAVEKQKIESYLALKYGVTLNNGGTDYVASTGNMMWSKADNTGYGYRITGIGRDDGSALYQKQSRSQETGAMVTIAQGNAIAASNQDNANTIQDLSFFVFSDDNKTTAYNVGIAGLNPGETMKRMARVSKVDKSAGWPNQNITVQTSVYTPQRSTYLVTSADATFMAPTSYKLLDATGQVTLDSSLLNDGSYFTFAEVQVDKTALQAKIADVNFENLVAADYTGSTWMAFQEALLAATGILGQLGATQSQVDAALADLTAARVGLAALVPANAPGGVNGASLWLKANDGATTAGGNLTGWTDQTGTNQFAVKGAPAYKASAANFNPAVTFENTANATQNPNQYLIGDKSITYQDGYAVFKQKDGTIIGSAAPRAGGYGVGIFTKWANKLWVGNGATGTYHGFSFNDASRYHMAGFDMAHSNDSQGRLNGTSQTITRKNSFNNISFTPVIGGTFGGGNSNNWYHYKGDIAEVVLFPASNTPLEKQQVESYLALKYGLTINNGKTNYVTSNGINTMWTAVNNAVYGNRITGIGRDDGSNLLQKQSKSQESGALVTIALGNEIKATNADNGKTINADKSFFIFSDNGATAKYETSVLEAPGHTLKQLNRMFKVEKTNWQEQDITLKLDVTAENPDVLYYLIIDGANSGITLNGGQATFNSSKLGNGSLFTFAKVYKNDLKVKVSGMKSLVEASYEPGSWAVLKTALADAEAVLNNPSATQVQVDAALAALEAARAGLSTGADKLQAKVDEIQSGITLGSLKPSDYTTGSWQALTEALDEAKALLVRSPQATAVEMGQALSKLEAAKGTLVDLSQLRAKEAGIVAENLKAENYGADGWQALQQALTEARAVLANPNATQAEVDAALAALEAARAALVPAAGKAALQARTNEINGENLKEADFKPEVWEALQKALVTAEAVLQDPNATQAEIDAALAALNAARNTHANKAALQAKTNEINGENLKEADYTPEIWQALNKALADAGTVLANPNATQSEVDAALAALTAARNNTIQSNAVLKKLDVIDSKNGNRIELSPVFDGTKDLNYKAAVSNAVYSVGINPQAAHPNSTLKVSLNGKEVGAADWGNLPLQEGENVIKVEVVDPNGKQNTYTITLMRNTNKLVSLVPSSGSLNPTFDPAKDTSYNLIVQNRISQLQWTPTALDPQAKIEISANGGTFAQVTSGTISSSFPLHVGVNTFTVKVTDRDGSIKEYSILVKRESENNNGNGGSSGSGSGSGSGTGSGSGSGTSNPTAITTSVNDKAVSFTTATTGQTGDGAQTTTVQVDADKLNGILSEGNGQKLSVHVPNEGNVKVQGITAALLKQMADSGSSLEVSNLLAIYPVPGKKLDLSAIAKNWNNAALGDIAVNIDIRRSDKALIDSARSKATAEGYELLVDPVDLHLSFTNGGKTVNAGQLDGYAAKYIALPEGIDPNRITTGVIINPDGTVFHVPTVVTKINNRYFALINDLHSSGTYSVIWNPKDFDDTKTHWAKADINNIAARLDLAGTGNNTWSPDRNINRSEFAAMISLGLGLMRQDVQQNQFHDVSSSAWYHDAVNIANEYGIVLGYEDGAFRGEQQITREQGIAMVARAFNLVEPQKAISQSEIDALLSAFGDANEVSSWAKETAALMVAVGIVEGKDGKLLKSQDFMTRAETAALIQRLLKKTKLID